VYQLLEVFLDFRNGISNVMFGEQTEEKGRDLVRYTVQPFFLGRRKLKKQRVKEEDIMYTFHLTALWLFNEVR
jgi:hypothetical protein